MPKSLRAALQALDESAVLRAALGDKVVEHYLHAGNWEQTEYDRRVTDWEVIRNFERCERGRGSFGGQAKLERASGSAQSGTSAFG